MRRSWRSNLLAATFVAVLPQGPGYRVTYRLRVVEHAGEATRLLATGVVSGPQEMDVRLSLHTDTAQVDALLGLLPEPDTVNISGTFFARRRAGRSRRGLPVWEEDSYRRWARLEWGGTTRLYPFGVARVGQRRSVWVEIAVTREPAAGDTRPSEEVTIVDSSLAFTAHAVPRPRRVTVRLALVRGDTASATRALDLVPDAPPRRVGFGLKARGATMFDVSLTRPEPARDARDSALAVDADVVCLRVVIPDAAEPARARCGRLDNVARRLALTAGDTLVATFAWPGVR